MHDTGACSLVLWKQRHQHAASALERFFDRRTTDTKVVFTGGRHMHLHMGVLRAASGYFASLADFKEWQHAEEIRKHGSTATRRSRNTSITYEVKAEDITDEPDLLRRLFLYSYTHRLADLDLTVENAFCFVKLDDFLALNEGLDLKFFITKCLSDHAKASRKEFASKLVDSFERSEVQADLMLAISKPLIFLESKEFDAYPESLEPRCLDVFEVPTLCLPVLWVLMANKHGLKYDALQIRMEIRNAIGENVKLYLTEPASKWFGYPSEGFNEAFDLLYGSVEVGGDIII
ncbi:uncharacterized protein EV422DRAFT_514435 [Fimicolochytrium jonesii]|uniref:uncharacterized protein n=1 Tax=Fimicolochytrium jonesii TaxID=1396493 RepID=UPI0022FE8B83|nr:uncharacterized protein EV422DRAFT_514435 [Fimicolochytrium jonesii]KAI8825850.1 hypothetical protein EV422DRAFT_514435 [Fimicolochytrium jonesii]